MAQMRHALGRAVLLGLISALLMGVAVVLRNEIWNARTHSLVAIWLFGGFFGTFGGFALLVLARKILGDTAQNVLRRTVFLPAFILAGASLFFLHASWQSGFDFHPDQPIRSALFRGPQIMALFVYSVSNYMLPWMAPLMIAAGWALMPGPLCPDRCPRDS